ncbi:hypothetical protein B0H66DRAFT_593257 [Apodospora peruviana]|uniref:SET domain-containing protein n=1 Tax=Apodospora peruviana TaxID=516989 RepID=A0AAE0M0G5_9PEZI|nr:hypothetical protein B0H66DRAFT_593257 [Apodospora peruviana]
MPTDKGTTNKLCVFTNTNFHFGQGVSIVARPETARKLVDDRLLMKSRYEYPSSDVKYEAIDRPALGVGLFVKPEHRYFAGETIMVDYPTLVLPSGAVDSVDLNLLNNLRWKALLQLSKETRARTRGLAQSKGGYMDEIVNVFDTNAFTHEKAGDLHDIIFAKAARMNHNCLPNAFTRTNHSSFAMEVIALRDIRDGEEITISYLDASTESTSKERRNKLSSDWNFDCGCSICAPGKGTKEESDRRREKIAKERKLLQSSRGDAAKIMRHVETMLGLFDEEGMIMPKAEYYALAAHASKHLGRRKDAMEFAELAKGQWNIIFGPESRECASMDEFQLELGAA